MSKLTSSQSKWVTMPRVLTLSVANFLSVSESVLMEKSCKTWYRTLNEDEKRWMREYERLYPVDTSALVKRLSHGKDKLIAKHLIRANWTANRYKEITLDASIFPNMGRCALGIYGSAVFLLLSDPESQNNGDLYCIDLEGKKPKLSTVTCAVTTLTNSTDAHCVRLLDGGPSAMVAKSVILAFSAQKQTIEQTVFKWPFYLLDADLDNKQQPTYLLGSSHNETVTVHKRDGSTLLSIPSDHINGWPEALVWPYLYSNDSTFDDDYKVNGSVFRYDLRTLLKTEKADDGDNKHTNNSNSQSKKINKPDQQLDEALNMFWQGPLFRFQSKYPNVKFWPQYNLMARADVFPNCYCVHDLTTGKLLRTVQASNLDPRYDDNEPVLREYSAKDQKFWDLRTGKLFATIKHPDKTVHESGTANSIAFCSDCIAYRWRPDDTAGALPAAAADFHKDGATQGYEFRAYVFTDGVEAAIDQIRSARAKIMRTAC